MKLLEIVMKDCQEAKLGRETVKLTLSLMMIFTSFVPVFADCLQNISDKYSLPYRRDCEESGLLWNG